MAGPDHVQEVAECMLNPEGEPEGGSFPAGITSLEMDIPAEPYNVEPDTGTENYAVAVSQGRSFEGASVANGSTIEIVQRVGIQDYDDDPVVKVEAVTGTDGASFTEVTNAVQHAEAVTDCIAHLAPGGSSP